MDLPTAEAEQRATILIVDRVVAGAGQHALVLHTPAFAHDLFASVWPHAVVDVEPGPSILLSLRLLDEAEGSGQVQRLTSHGGEATENTAHLLPAGLTSQAVPKLTS